MRAMTIEFSCRLVFCWLPLFVLLPFFGVMEKTPTLHCTMVPNRPSNAQRKQCKLRNLLFPRSDSGSAYTLHPSSRRSLHCYLQWKALKHRERHWILRNKLRVAGGEVSWGRWDNWVMHLKEGIWWKEHQVINATDESLTTTSETNNTLYVN